MKYIYAVLRETGGAHKSMDVMSVWTNKKLAQKEANKLNVLASEGYECEVRRWIVNETGDTINW